MSPRRLVQSCVCLLLTAGCSSASAARCEKDLYERRVERLHRRLGVSHLPAAAEQRDIKNGFFSYDPLGYAIPDHPRVIDRVFALAHEGVHARAWINLLRDVTPETAAQTCFIGGLDSLRGADQLPPNVGNQAITNEVLACYQSYRLKRHWEHLGVAASASRDPAFYLDVSRWLAQASDDIFARLERALDDVEFGQNETLHVFPDQDGVKLAQFHLPVQDGDAINVLVPVARAGDFAEIDVTGRARAVVKIWRSYLRDRHWLQLGPIR